MQTLYVVLAFLTMIALPFLISKRATAEADRLQAIGTRNSKRSF